MDQDGTCPNIKDWNTYPGCTVHYVAYNGQCLVATVIGCDSDKKADLAVFTNLVNSAGVKNFGLQFHQDVVFSKDLTPGTYHWIA